MSVVRADFHFFTILLLGCSATIWAVAETGYIMPILWLIILSTWIIFTAPQEFKMFLRRVSQIGLVLTVISLVQIAFRRQGEVILAIRSWPVVFSDGLREAILLWIRFMIIFMLAYIFSRVSFYEFLLFLTQLRVPLQFSLLLLTTLKFIPFIFQEAKKGLWTIRFRGIDIGQLSLRGKYLTLRKLLLPLLIRGIHYAAFSSLALELRGYGAVDRIAIPQSYPLRAIDYGVGLLIIAINLWGLFHL